MNYKPVLDELSAALRILIAIAVRVAAILALYSIPLLAAGFAEWSWSLSGWSVATRACVAVFWVVLTVFLLYVVASDSGKGVRKAGGV